MSDIFISYTRADRSRARRLADRLEAEGWSVWWDAEIAPGDAWSDRIEMELAAARCVIVLWSATSVAPERRFVRNEARDGLDRGLLVPVMLDEVPLPVEFRGLQAADLIRWGGQRAHLGLQQLLSAVAVKLGGAVRLARPALDALRPPAPGGVLDEAAVLRSVYALSLQGQPLGTGFGLAGCALIVTDANVHQGLLARTRHGVAAQLPLLQARAMAGDAACDASLALPPDHAQDVALLATADAALPPSAIGLADTPAQVGEEVLVAVAVGAGQGVWRGRLSAVSTGATIAGMEGGPAHIDELLATDIVTQPGSAGAPLLRPDGTLLGVIVAGDAQQSLAVPAARLRARLQAAAFVAL